MAENSGVYQEFATEKGPYAGIWIVVMILLLLPIGLYKLFFAIFTKFKIGNALMIEYQAKIFAGFISVLFDCSYILASGLQKPFTIVRKRVANFFGNVGYIGLKNSFKWYFVDGKEQGYAFWIIFSCILYNLYFLIKAFIEFINYIHM
jgi:hypothetical protein